MLRKEIESKIAKYLRKANRLRSTQAKLERINELIDIIQEASPHSSKGNGSDPGDTIQGDTSLEYLENYLELCYVHKIKFQMDAVFSGVKDDIKQLKQDREQISQDIFDSLVQRLQTVIEIDAEHSEALKLIQILHAEYNEYARGLDYSGLDFDIAQYKLPKLCIEILCNHQDIEGQDHLKATYQRYQVNAQQKKAKDPALPNNGSLCRMQFYVEHLEDFDRFHEELRVKPSYKITVNNRALGEQSFSDWFQCYKQFLKANNPQYCYGASPFTFNFFGCHKLYVKDIAKQLEKCWFRYGTLDRESELFLITKKYIAGQIQDHLKHCGFCPALTQKKLVLGMALIPRYINPEYDSRWRYYYTQGVRTSVIPLGNDIAISISSDLEGGRGVSHNGDKGGAAAEPPALIEVGPTPYVYKVLQYLKSDNSSDLAEPAYKGLSTCMNCGGQYKAHTMTCSRCRLDFWKYAMKDIEGVLDRLRYFKEIKPQIWDIETRGSKIEIRPPASDISEDTVSFDKLWSDPQVQEILASKQDTSSPEHRVSSLEPKPSDRLEFHEKLRSLVSRKYRERKALESAFSQQGDTIGTSKSTKQEYKRYHTVDKMSKNDDSLISPAEREKPGSKAKSSPSLPPDKAALINAVKSLKPRQKSELSKRGVVRVIYHATMDKETCPLCNYLDGIVMDPDDPATDIFSPPLYPGCTCSREYVLKTEKPKNWPRVTFKFPPNELLVYLDKETKSKI